MQRLLILISLISINAPKSLAQVVWDNPPVLCPEQTLARGYTCPDFSNVKDPYTEFPSTLSQEEITEWTSNRPVDLRLCRNLEVLKREKAQPGTYPEATLKGAWMVTDGGKNVPEKLASIEAASIKTGIPPQILIGALKQESGLSSIGVAPDGGNYSCGMSQMNIQEWCESVTSLSSAKRAELGWPNISCDSLPTTIVKPFYDIAAKKNAGVKPLYTMTAVDYADIKAKDVGLEEKPYAAVASFLKHCQDFSLSISFKAQTLKNLYDHFVPSSMKEAERYNPNETFPKQCNRPYPVNAYPLHTGWLLAVAMYNAGPVQAKLVGHYFHVENNNYPELHPLDLIEALHWGGKWKLNTDSVIFFDQNGKEYTQRWFKSCIVQRHVARVIQHVTEYSKTIATPLDQDGCKQLIPEYRKITSGQKDIQ